jgi:2-polyprenyl-3-methyl-5-hydroxy-6-metoxy-1,4-benzoquinol methylase
MDVIEHVDDQNKFVETISQAVAENGLAMISTIDKSFKTWFTHIFLAEYVSRIVPTGTHHYKQFMTVD